MINAVVWYGSAHRGLTRLTAFRASSSTTWIVSLPWSAITNRLEMASYAIEIGVRNAAGTTKPSVAFAALGAGAVAFGAGGAEGMAGGGGGLSDGAGTSVAGAAAGKLAGSGGSLDPPAADAGGTGGGGRPAAA